MSRTEEPPEEGQNAVSSDSAAPPPAIRQTVELLVNTLGAGVVAVIVDRDAKTVSEWIGGQAQIGGSERRKLIDACEIVSLLLANDPPPVVRAWFMGMNPQLNDENPAELLAAGRANDVMAAARAFVGG